MSKIDAKMDIVFEHTLLITKNIEQILGVAVRKVAFDVQYMAQAAVPVDTGAAKNSIYVVTDLQSTYGEAVEAVQNANPKTEMLPEQKPEHPLEALVVCGVEYGPYIEYPTVKSGAQPFMGPAAERGRDMFIGACTAGIKKVAAGV